MDSKLSFSEQYKHPKWQEKRLEAFNKVKEIHGLILCERCYDGETQIQNTIWGV